MMRSTLHAKFGVTSQTVLHRMLTARPTAITFDVLDAQDDDNATAQFSGTCTLDTVDTTIGADSGASSANPKQITLASTTGIIAGRVYRLSEAQKVEWVEVLEVVSATVVLTRNPLKNDYTLAGPGDFDSTYFTLALDDTWIADENNISEISDGNPDWRARVVATVAGVSVPDYFFFDVLRTPVEHGITITDLVNVWASILHQLPDSYKPDRAQAFINATAVKFDSVLSAYSKHDQALRDFHAWDEGVVLLCLKRLAMQGYHPPGLDAIDYVTLTTDDFDRYIEMHFNINAPHDQAVGTGGGASEPAYEPLFSR